MKPHRKPVSEIVLTVSLLLGSLAANVMPASAATFAGLLPMFAAEGEAESGKPKKKGYADEAVKHYNRGVEFHQNGSLNQAIQEYKLAIEADGRLAEAYSNLGAVYLAQKSFTKAADAFNKALALKPDRPTTLNGLGNALYARGLTAEAKDKWAKAIEIDPNFASAYYNMGNAFESEKDEKAALGEYMKAIDVSPKMADAYYRIGGILHKTKHTAQANVFLKRSLELSPNAEFLRDAQKMMKEEELEFSKDATAKEVEMTVVPLSKDGSAGSSRKTTSGDSAVAAVEKKTTASKTASPVKEKSTGTTATDSGAKPRFPLFRRKPKEEKKVEMFVQPSGASNSAQDLKPSPSDAPTETGGDTPAPVGDTQSNGDTWK